MAKVGTVPDDTRETRPAKLWRYMKLPALIQLLYTKQIVLLDPATWVDKNDAHFLEQYKDRKGAESVLALCFFMERERYHHWGVYAKGMDGVCIEFDGCRLLDGIEADGRIRHRKVSYRTLSSMRSSRPDVDGLPFVKRYAYKDEQEYRIIYVDTQRALNKQEVEIDISWIGRIVLSPWLPEAFVESLANTLRVVGNCPELPVEKSRLVDNEAWKEFALEAHSRERDVLEQSFVALKDAMMFLAIAVGGQPTAASHAEDEAVAVDEQLATLGDNHFWEAREVGERMRRIADWIKQYARAWRSEKRDEVVRVGRMVNRQLSVEEPVHDDVFGRRCQNLESVLRELASVPARNNDMLPTGVLDTLYRL